MYERVPIHQSSSLSLVPVQVSFEMAVVANATGFRCDKQAMHGPDLDAHIDDAYKVSPYAIDPVFKDC